MGKVDDEFDDLGDDFDLGMDEFFPMGDDFGSDPQTDSDGKVTFKSYAKNLLGSAKKAVTGTVDMFLPEMTGIVRELGVAKDELKEQAAAKLDVATKFAKDKMGDKTFKDSVKQFQKEFFTDMKKAITSGDLTFGANKGFSFDMGMEDFDDDSSGSDEGAFVDANNASAKKMVNATVASTNALTDVNLNIFRANTKQTTKMYAGKENRDTARHMQSVGYLASIDSNVAKITAFIGDIGVKSAAAQMEYSEKSLAMQQDTVSLLNIIKEQTFTPSNERVDRERSVLGQIFGGGFDGGEYGKGVGKNIGDMIMSSPIGMIMSSLGTMSMLDGMGPKKSAGEQVMSTLLPMIPGLFLNQQAKTSLDTLNDSFGGLMGAMNNKFVTMAMNSENPILNMIGSTLGIRESSAVNVDLGVKDLNAKATFDQKFYSTVTKAIPGFLGKILSAVGGKGEEYFDHKTGIFKSAKHAELEFDNRKKTAFSSSNKWNKVKEKFLVRVPELAEKFKIDRNTLSLDFETIFNNIATGTGEFTPGRVEKDEGYKKALLTGVQDERSLKIFQFAFQDKGKNGMAQVDQNYFALSLGDVQTKVKKFYKEEVPEMYDNAAGGSFLADKAYREQEEAAVRNIDTLDLSYKYIDKDGNITNQFAYNQNKIKRRKMEEEHALKYGGRSKVMEDFQTTDVGQEAADGRSGASPLNVLSNIYELMLEGIIVYPKKGVAEFAETKKVSHKEAARKSKEDSAIRDAEIQDKLDELMKQKLEAQLYQYTSGLSSKALLSQLDKKGGDKGLKGKVSRGVLKGTDSVEKMIHKLLFGDDMDFSESAESIVDKQNADIQRQLDNFTEMGFKGMVGAHENTNSDSKVLKKSRHEGNNEFDESIKGLRLGERLGKRAKRGLGQLGEDIHGRSVDTNLLENELNTQARNKPVPWDPKTEYFSGRQVIRNGAIYKALDTRKSKKGRNLGRDPENETDFWVFVSRYVDPNAPVANPGHGASEADYLGGFNTGSTPKPSSTTVNQTINSEDKTVHKLLGSIDSKVSSIFDLMKKGTSKRGTTKNKDIGFDQKSLITALESLQKSNEKDFQRVVDAVNDLNSGFQNNLEGLGKILMSLQLPGLPEDIIEKMKKAGLNIKIKGKGLFGRTSVEINKGTSKWIQRGRRFAKWTVSRFGDIGTGYTGVVKGGLVGLGGVLGAAGTAVGDFLGGSGDKTKYPNWNETESYKKGQGVSYKGKAYKSLLPKGKNIGLKPKDTPEAWECVGKLSKTGGLIRGIGDGFGKAFSATAGFYGSILSGAGDALKGSGTGKHIPWDETESYKKGRIVSYKGKAYKNLLPKGKNIGLNPKNTPEAWELIGNIKGGLIQRVAGGIADAGGAITTAFGKAAPGLGVAGGNIAKWFSSIPGFAGDVTSGIGQRLKKMIAGKDPEAGLEKFDSPEDALNGGKEYTQKEALNILVGEVQAIRSKLLGKQKNWAQRTFDGPLGNILGAVQEGAKGGLGAIGDVLSKITGSTKKSVPEDSNKTGLNREGSSQDQERDQKEEDKAASEKKMADTLVEIRDNLKEQRKSRKKDQEDLIKGFEKSEIGKNLEDIERNVLISGAGGLLGGGGIGGKFSKFAKGAKIAGKIGLGAAAVGVTAYAGKKLYEKSNSQSSKEVFEDGTVGDRISHQTGTSGSSSFSSSGREMSESEKSARSTSVFKARAPMLMALGFGYKKLFSGLGDVGKAGVNIAKRGIDAGKKIPVVKNIISKLEDLVQKVLKSKQVMKITKGKFGTAVLQAVKSIINPKVLASPAASKGILKSLAKYAGGPVGIALLVNDFITGMDSANRYFELGRGAKVSFGMRLTAGVANMLSCLLFGFIPSAKIAKMIFGLLGNAGEKEFAADFQVFMGKKATILRVEHKRLMEYETKNFWERIFGSKKSNSKLLNFKTIGDFEEWLEKIYKPVEDLRKKIAKPYGGDDVVNAIPKNENHEAKINNFRSEFLKAAESLVKGVKLVAASVKTPEDEKAMTSKEPVDAIDEKAIKPTTPVASVTPAVTTASVAASAAVDTPTPPNVAKKPGASPVAAPTGPKKAAVDPKANDKGRKKIDEINESVGVDKAKDIKPSKGDVAKVASVGIVSKSIDKASQSKKSEPKDVGNITSTTEKKVENSPVADNMMNMSNAINTELGALKAIYAEQSRHNIIDESMTSKLVELLTILVDNSKATYDSDISRNEILAKQLLAEVDPKSRKRLLDEQKKANKAPSLMEKFKGLFGDSDLNQDGKSDTFGEKFKSAFGGGGGDTGSMSFQETGEGTGMTDSSGQVIDLANGDQKLLGDGSLDDGKTAEQNAPTGTGGGQIGDLKSQAAIDKYKQQNKVTTFKGNAIVEDPKKLSDWIQKSISGWGATHEKAGTVAMNFEGTKIGDVTYYTPKNKKGDIITMRKFLNGDVEYGIDNSQADAFRISAEGRIFGKDVKTAVLRENYSDNTKKSGTAKAAPVATGSKNTPTKEALDKSVATGKSK